MDHSPEIKKAYLAYQANRTLKSGWILALIGIPAIIFFTFSDIYALGLSVTQSVGFRSIGLLPLLIYASLLLSKFKEHKQLIISYHALALTCILIMIAGLAFIIFDIDYQSELYDRRFAVVSGYLLVILGGFVLSAGAKKNFKYIVGIPTLILMIALAANQRMSFTDWGMVTNIIVGVAVTIILSHQQSRAEFRKFELQKRLEISEEALRQHRNSLQNRVEERTKELKEARDHADAMNKLKTIMLGNLTHELKTPAGTVRSLVDLFRMSPSEEDLTSYTQMLQESSDRLLGTIENTIRFSELESGVIKPEWENISIYDLIQRVSKDYKPAIDKKGLLFKLPVDTGIIINSDGQILRQILQNLLDNAIKFTASGEIEIACEFNNQTFEMQVKDTGKGIAAEAIPFITDSFRQESEGLNREHQGAGLGLAMVKGYLNILGGKLLVESEENKGSVFTCRIPVREASL